MAIVRKPNGTFYVVLYLGENRRKWVRAGKSKRAARALELELTAKVRRGEYHECKPIAFSDFADKWMEDYVSVLLKPVTQREYGGYLKNYWKPLFGRRKLTSIRPDDVQRHVALLVREGRLKPKSIKNQVACLRRLMRTAEEWGYLNSNPVRHVAVPRQERQEMKFLTPPQMLALVEAAKDKTAEHAALALACGTGMRKSEIRGLLLTSLDLGESPSVTVRTTVVGNTDQVVETTKSRAGHRTIPLPEYVRDAVMSHVMTMQDNDAGLLFARKDGRPVRAEWFNDVLIRNARKAVVPQCRFHDLRHSFVAACLVPDPVTGAVIPLPILQRIAGHESVTTTLSVYGHLVPEATRVAADAIQATVFART